MTMYICYVNVYSMSEHVCDSRLSFNPSYFMEWNSNRKLKLQDICMVKLLVWFHMSIYYKSVQRCGRNIQYWYIDGKYRIYVARFRNGGKMSFSESFHPFRTEQHKFYIYRQYTNIVFILQEDLQQQKMLFNLKI